MEEILDALPAFGIHGLRSIPEPIPGLERFAQAFTPIQAKEQTMKKSSKTLVRALALVALVAAFASQTGVKAFDVCTDDYDDRGVYSCAHEQMFDEALRFYQHLVVPNRFSQEILAYAADIRAGVGAPDAGDPLYDNTGFEDALITITHFWQPDQSIGQPQVQVLDPYPNAFNAAQALWTRALGEYAAGNTAGAYRFLGMIAHFLGDQTVPAHAHGDTHPETFGDGDPFEEFMSNPELNKTLLTEAEFDGLVAQGLIDLPNYENIDKLLWLFLNVNQVAGYFGSDDNDGDSNLNSDPRYPYADTYAAAALNEVMLACAEDGNCPTDADDIQDNDNNDYPYYYNGDGDMDRIRRYSYVPGVRKLAALLSLWEKAIQEPILTLSVLRMQETGLTDAFVCLGGTEGLDTCGQPDYYVGVIMGNRRRSAVPPGALLESDDDDHSYREDEGQYFPAAATRTDANNDNIAGNKTLVSHNYYFGQSFSPDPNTGQFLAGTDIIDLSFIVRDLDVTMVTSSPYGDDDLAFIHPNGTGRVNLSVDLRHCADRTAGGITVDGVGTFVCAPDTADAASRILVGGGRGGDGDFGEDSSDVDVMFHVNVFVPDIVPPAITCDPPDGQWHPDNVVLHCTATDEGSGLADSADASFDLSTHVGVGIETANAFTDSREVCDAVGNCATAGPIGGNKIDRKAPVIVITQPAATEYTHSDTLVLDYSVTDGGSGVDTVTPRMNGDTMLASGGLADGRAILLLTALPLGDHTFTVNADDHVGNLSPTESVTFSIIVTPESLIQAITIFEGLGGVKSALVQSLLAKLVVAAEKFNSGDCLMAENIYRAFISDVQAQRGKGITAFAADVLIADAEYLIANCP
jgi:hypothetical protein